MRTRKCLRCWQERRRGIRTIPHAHTGIRTLARWFLVRRFCNLSVFLARSGHASGTFGTSANMRAVSGYGQGIARASPSEPRLPEPKVQWHAGEDQTWADEEYWKTVNEYVIKLSTVEETMHSASLYTVTVGEGRTTQRFKKSGHVGSSERAELDVQIFQSKGFKLLCASHDNTTQEQLEEMTKANCPIIAKTLSWTNSAFKRAKEAMQESDVTYSTHVIFDSQPEIIQPTHSR